jgi:hypothetical protein
MPERPRQRGTVNARNAPRTFFGKTSKFLDFSTIDYNVTMAPTLGKRKRQAPVPTKADREVSVESSNSLEEDAQAIFKRHFEAQFKPLPTVKKATKVVEEVSEEEGSDETDWEGISEPGGEAQ